MAKKIYLFILTLAAGLSLFAVEEIRLPLDLSQGKIQISGGKCVQRTQNSMVLEFDKLSKNIVLEIPLNGFNATACDTFNMEFYYPNILPKISVSCLGMKNDIPYLNRQVWAEKPEGFICGFFPDVGVEKRLKTLRIRLQDFLNQEGNLKKPLPGRKVTLTNCYFLANDKLLPKKLVPVKLDQKLVLNPLINQEISKLQSHYTQNLQKFYNAKSVEEKYALLCKLHALRLNEAFKCESKILSILSKNQQLIYAAGNGIDKIYRFGSCFPGVIGGTPKISLARNEYEATQIALYSSKNIKNVSVSISPLTCGNQQLKAFIAPVGFIHRLKMPKYYRPEYQWFPDPILNDLKNISMEKGCWQPWWIEVYAQKEQLPGIYSGLITISEAGKRLMNIPIEVRVWNFSLPDKKTFPIAISSGFSVNSNSAVAKFYCKNPQIRQQAYQLLCHDTPSPSIEAQKLAKIVKSCVDMLDNHYIHDDSLYHDLWTEIPAKYRKMHLKEEKTFNLGNPYGGKADLKHLEKQVALSRKDGSYPFTYVYGFDEIKTIGEFKQLKDTFSAFKSRFPDLKTMTTAWDFSCGDIHDAWKYTDIWVLPTNVYISRPHSIAKARKRGQKIWWYPCDYPQPPSANIFLENSGVATRAHIGVMSWLFGADGYIFYASASWSDRRDSDCLINGWKASPRKNVQLTGQEIDGEPWSQQYTMFTDNKLNQVSFNSKWRKLNQKKKSSLIIFEGDFKIEKPFSDEKNSFFAKAFIKYTNGKSKVLTLSPKIDSFDWQHLKVEIEPKDKIAAFTIQVMVKGINKKVSIKNISFRVKGEKTTKLTHLNKPYGDEILRYDDYPGYYSSGCGSFILPGKSGPVATLRLKHFRDGIEDYEYLMLLKNKINEIKKSSPLNGKKVKWLNEAEKLLQINENICVDIDRYAESGETILNFREQIANLLQDIPNE